LKSAPAERLGVFAFLLGACGGEQDADLLHQMILENSERSRAALSGLLGGYIKLRPEAGWQNVWDILADEQRPFGDKLAVLGTVRFYHGWKPEDAREPILKAMETLVRQGDLADLAIEDLRRWHWWDLTNLILAQFGRESHSAPLVERAIVRYALSCPKSEAEQFVTAVAQRDPEMVNDLREALEFEKSGPAPAGPDQ
jgi:hypothetical protein